MKKAIVVLSGVPAGKNRFTDVCKSIAWVWSINPKNRLDKASPDYSALEQKYLLENIERYLADEDESKSFAGKEYRTFLLLAHGVSGKQMEMLKSDYGVYKIHIVSSQEEITDAMLSHNDLVLIDTDEDFSGKILSIISILTKEG